MFLLPLAFDKKGDWILVQVDKGGRYEVVTAIQSVGLMKPIVAAEVKKRIADGSTVQ